MSVGRLQELVSKVETEFPDRVQVQNFDFTAEGGDEVVYFEPVNAAAAPLNIRFSCGNYSISYANETAVDSSECVPDDEAFDWALDRVREVARFGLVFINMRWFFGLLPGSEYLVPSSPQGSPAFEEELQRRVRPVIRRAWEPW